MWVQGLDKNIYSLSLDPACLEMAPVHARRFTKLRATSSTSLLCHTAKHVGSKRHACH